jgi:hypothetical protein
MSIKIQDRTENVSHKSHTNTTTTENIDEAPVCLVQAVA